MTFRQLLIQFNPIDCKNKLNDILALTERHFGVFSPDMELDIRSIITNENVADYFDRIIHEEHPKLEYDGDEKKSKSSSQKGNVLSNEKKLRREEQSRETIETAQKIKEEKEAKERKLLKKLEEKRRSEIKMPWDDEQKNLTIAGIDFNFPNDVTICVAHRKYGALKRERIQMEVLSINQLVQKKYLTKQQAGILMLAFVLLTLNKKVMKYDYIHYSVRGKYKNGIGDLWSKALGIFEQLDSPEEVISKYGLYQIVASKRRDFQKRIFRIKIPENAFFKWGLPQGTTLGWNIAVYLTNTTKLREKRKSEYAHSVREVIKNQPKKSKHHKETTDTFSFVHSNWSNAWGHYNLVDD